MPTNVRAFYTTHTTAPLLLPVREMGAGASAGVDENGGGAGEDVGDMTLQQEKARRASYAATQVAAEGAAKFAIGETADASAADASDHASDLGESGPPAPIAAPVPIGELLGDVPEESAATINELFEKASAAMSPEAVAKAAEEVTGAIASGVVGDGLLATAGAAINTAAEQAPEIIEAMAVVLLGVASHLPFVAGAAGILGGVVAAFQQSKHDDKNVATVTVWSASIKDWLILVAGRVGRSGADSTAPLFKALHEQLKVLVSLIEGRKTKSRLSKMLTGAMFGQDFEYCKNAVKDLKLHLKV